MNYQQTVLLRGVPCVTNVVYKDIDCTIDMQSFDIVDDTVRIILPVGSKAHPCNVSDSVYSVYSTRTDSPIEVDGVELTKRVSIAEVEVTSIVIEEGHSKRYYVDDLSSVFDSKLIK
jgi:hypothetical protein